MPHLLTLPAPTLRTLATAVVAVALAATACQPTPTKRSSDPVVLLGIDGLEWKILLDLLHEGRAPNLAALMRRGTYGKLASTQPTMSPIIWTTIATGVDRKKHGIKGFVRPPHDGSDGLVVYSSSDRKRKALCNILSDAGRRTHTIGWWNTYPVEKVNGVMIAQANTTTLRDKVRGTGIWKGTLVAGLRDQVYPPQRQSDFLKLLPEVEDGLPTLEKTIFGTAPQNPSKLAARLWEQSRWSLRADALYARLASALLAESNAAPFDLFSVYFGGADVTGHRFWRYMQPEPFETKPPADEVAVLSRVIHDYCVYLDGVIGDLLAAAPPNANVLVVSDHGMRPHNTRAKFRAGDPAHKIVSAAHGSAPAGVFIAAGPAIRVAYPQRGPATVQMQGLTEVGSVLDIAPTVLALLGMPNARDFDGKVLDGLFSENFAARKRPETIDSYTEAGWAEDRREAAGEVNMSERIEQLRSLGYLQ